MAEIIARFDTKAKTLSVTIDGKEVENVTDVYLSKSYYDDDKGFRCSLTTLTEDKEDDLRRYTMLSAAESPEAQSKPDALPCPEFPGFVASAAERTPKVAADVLDYFSRD